MKCFPKRLPLVPVAALALAAIVSASAAAEEVEVKMLNKGAAGMMVFEPSLVTIQPGDSVRFVPTDQGHNAQSIAGMVPEGATSFEGRRDEEIVVTFEREGIYGFECKPHAGMGMVGVVVVGEAGDTAAALETAKLKGKGKKVMQGLLAQLSD
jgi:pseudoazurin